MDLNFHLASSVFVHLDISQIPRVFYRWYQVVDCHLFSLELSGHIQVISN